MESLEAQCLICMEQYNEDVLKPMILKCGHSICRECLKYFLGKISTSRQNFDIYKEQKYKNDEENFRLCPKCRTRVMESENIEEYNVNYGLLDLLRFIRIENKPENLSLEICCCPPDIDTSLFQQRFLAQLTKFKCKEISQKNQPNSQISEKILTITFNDITSKKEARDLYLPGKIYRQTDSEQHIYIVVSKNDPQLPDSFKQYMNQCEFAMVQYGVPMLRGPTDLIRINNASRYTSFKDCKMIEDQIKRAIGQEANELAVRHYNETYQNSFIAIFLGDCRKMQEVIDLLLNMKSIKFGRNQQSAQVIPIRDAKEFPNVFIFKHSGQ